MIQRLIQERLGDLPPGQAEVARFIAQNPQEAAFLTAAQIGLRVGVSESTVIRLAMALGYPGFPEMKAALAGQVRDQLSTLERLHRYDETSVEPSLLRRALREDMSNLSGALLSVDEEALEALASAIVQAKETYILGLRSAHSLAYYLWFYLSWFWPHVQLLGRETIWERITQERRKRSLWGELPSLYAPYRRGLGGCKGERAFHRSYNRFLGQPLGCLRSNRPRHSI